MIDMVKICMEPVNWIFRRKKRLLIVILVIVVVLNFLAEGDFFDSPPESVQEAAAVEPGVTATVTSDALNFRSGPSTGTRVLKTLRMGDILTVTGDVAGGWLPVEYDGEQGYVSAELVSINE
jgi:uncharacterized protein YgiM (DUF1202 family)